MGQSSHKSPDVAGYCSVLHATGQSKQESANEEPRHRLPEPVAEVAQAEERTHGQGPGPPAISVRHQTS